MKKEFVWTEALDVKNELLNDEHKQILHLMNNLWQMNSKVGTNKQDLLFHFDELTKCTKNHFADEEKHMQEIDFSEFEQHKKIYDDLLDMLENHRKEFSNDVAGRIPSAVFDFFNTWLKTHIMVIDKRYSM